MTPAQVFIADIDPDLMERRLAAWRMRKIGKSTREICRTLDINNSTLSVFCREAALFERVQELEAQLEQK